MIDSDELSARRRDAAARIKRMNEQMADIERTLAEKNKQLEHVLSDMHEAESTISFLERDRLTGLYTSPGFLRRAKRFVRDNPGEVYDAIVFEVNGFRQVNEVFGRRAGDELLRSLAQFITGMECASRSLFGRVGTSTFFVFSPAECHMGEALHVQAGNYLARYPLPLYLQLSIGVCLGGDLSVSPEEECNRARLAFESLGDEHGRIAYYDVSMLEESLKRHQILEGVSSAIENGELRLYLQSKVDMRTHEVIGAEALVRWEHPTLGFLTPADFIPTLEKENRVFAVDQYIFEESCRVQKERRDKGLPMLPISVNMARSDFYEPDVFDVLQKLLSRYGLDPSAIRIEVIERAYAQDTGPLPGVLSELRKSGFVIEMDDFGTGESSLSMLADAEVDVLKLDRGFVRESVSNERRLSVIDSVIQLADNLGMEVIAEGVENCQQECQLLSLGCRYAQGYYYAKPRPAVYFLDAQ